ncbi:MAG: efflux RND transporter periplasmic adaptor subunit [Pseudomonadota bacterium]
MRATALTACLLCALPAMAQDQPVAPAVLRAVQEATIATEVGAQIVELPLEEGEAFAAGDLLARFDCDRIEAEAEAARASHRAADEIRRTNERLDRLGAIGKGEARRAAAEAEAADASAKALEIVVADCEIRAPYAGRLVARLVNPFETLEVGQDVLSIVGTDLPRVELIVPSVWLRWLREGDRFTLAVNEVEATVPAQVLRIGAAIDPVSRTVRVTGVITNEDAGRMGLLPGMSGSARFQAPNG